MERGGEEQRGRKWREKKGREKTGQGKEGRGKGGILSPCKKNFCGCPMIFIVPVRWYAA